MRDLTLPTDPPPIRTLDIAEYDVIDGPGGIPHGLVWVTCRRPGCESTYVLPLECRLDQLGQAAHAAGWTLHTSLGPVCPAHPAGTPVAALEASAEALNRSRQELMETGEWDPATLLAAAEDVEDRCVHCKAPLYEHRPGAYVHANGFFACYPDAVVSTEATSATPAETTVPDAPADTEEGDDE